MGSLAAVAVALVGAAGVAEWQREVAEAQRQIAVEQQRIATAERDKATENFQIATQTAESMVSDIARRLRNVQGLSAETVRRILETAKSAYDRLAAAAPADLYLQHSRGVLLEEFGDSYLTLGDLDMALTMFRESLT